MAFDGSTEYIFDALYPRRSMQSLLGIAMNNGVSIYGEELETGEYVMNFDSRHETAMQELCMERGVIPSKED